VGVQYFSQQAVARLLPAAGIDVPKDMPFPARLVEVQKLMAAGDARARKVYEAIGTYLGYTIPHYSDFYEVRNLLVLGRVTTGEGGDLIIATAKKILASEFPEIGEKVRFHTPSEKEKRHGQAVVAASLPRLRK
jgi:predicted NBD/HSP70 family sugar kinase